MNQPPHTTVAPHQTAHAHSSTALPHIHRGTQRWLKIVATLGLAIGGAALAAGILSNAIPSPFHTATAPRERESKVVVTPTVKVIRPRTAENVPIVIDQLATVEPYFLADLRARASGIVKRVPRDIGDKVQKGEILVEIDVPELDQDVVRAEATIQQRELEWKVAEAKLKDAQAARGVSVAAIKQREADVLAISATRDLRKRRLDRYRELVAKGSVVDSLVEEEERDYIASESGVMSAQASVERARADFAQAESMIQTVAADVELKKYQIELARNDLDRAKTIAGFAKVLAPFDGVVIRRNVDPGSFVQNATTGSSETLISLARVDVVSVVAKFPDTVASLVTDNTSAVIQIDQLPDATISSTVTRFAPSVLNSDRTMRIEVDLFNGDASEYERLVQDRQAPESDRQMKGQNDPIPVRAFAGNAASYRRLIPGMTGTMRLTVGGFGKSYVLPATAVYSRSGASYILVVENGKTRQVPVRVQLSDGNTVRLAIVSNRSESNDDASDLLTELTGNEEVVAARQLEIGDGATVNSAPSNW